MPRRSNRKRKNRSFTQKVVFLGSWVAGFSIVSALCLLLIYGARAKQFDIEEVGRGPAGTEIFDAQGEVITTLQGGQSLVSREEIPEFLIDCLLAREDTKFYEHGGVDWKGLARATLRNLKDRQFTQGASTLTMQLARNTYEIRAKSIDRKLLEIALTKRIESRYEKNEIVTQYLNRIYFGSGAYGIADAADTYFGRQVKDLSAGQCATLVGIIRAPHDFSPLRNPELAQAQKEQVLKRLVTIGKISQDRAEVIKAEPLAIQKKTPDPGSKTYAVQAAIRHLRELLPKAKRPNVSAQIHTTLDLRVQAQLDHSVDQILSALAQPSSDEPVQCSAVTIEHTTGAVRALTGGRDFSESKFNRALDARRALGLAIAPFINAFAHQRGKLSIKGKPVQVGRQLGLSETVSLLPRLGFEAPFGEGDDVFRGAVATSSLQVATALSALSAGGQLPRTFFIASIGTRGGETVFANEPSPVQVLSPEAAREGVKSLGKNGVLLDYAFADANLWVLISSDSFSTALWFGYDTPAPLKRDKATARTIRRAAEDFQRGN